MDRIAIRSDGNIHLIIKNNRRCSIRKVYDGKQFGRALDYRYDEDYDIMPMVVISENGVYFSESILEDQIKFHVVHSIKDKTIVGILQDMSTVVHIFYKDGDVFSLRINDGRPECMKLSYEQSLEYSQLSDGFIIFDNFNNTPKLVTHDGINDITAHEDQVQLSEKLLDFDNFNKRSNIEIIPENITFVDSKRLSGAMRFIIVEGTRISLIFAMSLNGIGYFTRVIDRSDIDNPGIVKTVLASSESIYVVGSNTLSIISNPGSENPNITKLIVGVSDIRFTNPDEDELCLIDIYNNILFMSIDHNGPTSIVHSNINLPDASFPMINVFVPGNRKTKSVAKR